ncbi:MAG: succinate dehydrogenase assembly factor 2 [Alphaproteobacteria bacterium]
MDETIEIRRKRLKHRSRRCGMRELDLLLGEFADACLDRLTADQLERYEALLAHPDPEIYRWISGDSATSGAVDAAIVKLIRDFHDHNE